MPWELCLVRYDGTPPRSIPDEGQLQALDTISGVTERLKKVVPGLEVFREPSGPEKLRYAELAGFEFPPVVAEFMRDSPATTKGVYEGNRFSLEFYFGHGPVVKMLDIEVRGSGDPWPVLLALMEVENWAIYEYSSRQLLRKNSSKLWRRFQRFVRVGKKVVIDAQKRIG